MVNVRFFPHKNTCIYLKKKRALNELCHVLLSKSSKKRPREVNCKQCPIILGANCFTFCPLPSSKNFGKDSPTDFKLILKHFLNRTK